ncbi:MAG: fliD [Modestobacter sp.]|nr:fliD [Modestobacter sp.]
MGTGLSSGIDYSTMITQLMQIEARPQTLLKSQLSDTQTATSAYREINTALAALSSAAQALTGEGMTSARRATSSSTTVTTSAGATAVPGSSISFAVTKLASSQTSLSAGTWTSATGDVRTATPDQSNVPGWPLTVVRGGKTVGTIDLPANATLNDAATKINESGYGLSATVVQLDSGRFKLQISSSATGAAAAFNLTSSSDATGTRFTRSTDAGDATLDLGNGLTATSPTNTFTDLLTGVSVTVSQPSDPVTAKTTVSVANDTSAVTGKVKAMIDAANTALNAIGKHTDSGSGSTAALKGNWTLTNLANQILRQVSTAVAGPAVEDGELPVDSSPVKAGIQLTKSGAITFDAATFSSVLASNPALAQQIAGGRTGVGTDNVDHTSDDTISVDGIAARLSVLAERASDSASGMITTLANSQDVHAKDLQKQIDAWGLRLSQRKTTLTAQFNAMESALGTLQNQASWLSSQINSLPSWNKSNA